MAASKGETRRLLEPPVATAVAVPIESGSATLPAIPSAPPATEDEDEEFAAAAALLTGAVLVPGAPAPQLVEVVSPGTLPGGYGFDAVFGGQVFTAIVPPGGVTKGQRFTVSFSPGPSSSASDVLPPPGVGGPHYPPRGRFRDGLCDCCTRGPCHPSLCNAWLCPQILTAQVMVRMHLDWLGGKPRHGSSLSPAGKDDRTLNLDEPWKRTFRKVLLVVIAYYLTTFVLDPFVRPRHEIAADGTVETFDPRGPPSLIILNDVVATLFALYTLFILARTRRAVREAYAIPPGRSVPCCGRCGGGCVEDVCCAFFCGCCTAAQLARHTADYGERTAACCSGTGLPHSDPALIV